MSKYGALSRVQRRIRQLGASSLSCTRLAITTPKTDRDDALVSSAPDPRFRKKSASGRTRYHYALSSGYTRFHKPTWQLLFLFVIDDQHLGLLQTLSQDLLLYEGLDVHGDDLI